MLDELNDLFMEVKDAEPEYTNLPDGEYLAKVVSAKYTLSKSDKPMVQFTFEITDGEFKGRTHNKFMLLCGNDEAGLRRNLNRYGTELKKYGIIATSIKDSFEQVEHTVGTEVKLTLSTKNEFLNTSVEVL